MTFHEDTSSLATQYIRGSSFRRVPELARVYPTISRFATFPGKLRLLLEGSKGRRVPQVKKLTARNCRKTSLFFDVSTC
jgi:hypothetical protein